MNNIEFRVLAALASIFSLRMLGLCLLLPVFALEASKYPAATAQLIGIAVGIYGLMQALLQIPFGVLSDKYGRRPLILVGLCLLVLGSLICYKATSIFGLIVGRCLQGSGAIGSVVIAALIDHTREQVRVRAMAILGMSIGLAFVFALAGGPWFNQVLGFKGVFMLTALLALGGIILLRTIPKNTVTTAAKDLSLSRHNWREFCFNPQLGRLYFGIFALHASLAALFLVLPLLIQKYGVDADQLWILYAFALVLALLIALSALIYYERRQQLDLLQLLAISGLLLAELGLCFAKYPSAIIMILVIFFSAFCILEASLPTQVSKYAPSNKRGAALGLYSSLQFLGIFFGGMIGGYLHGRFGSTAVLGLCMGLAASWLGLIFFRGKLEWQEASIK